MSTQSKLNANRTNAKQSTGPRTAAGKAASSRNSLKHGLCSADPLLPGENPAGFEALHQDLIRHFHPIGESEEKLVMRIAAGQWRLDRIFPMEAGIYRDGLYKVAVGDLKRQDNYELETECAIRNGIPAPVPPAIDPSDALARAFKTDADGSNTLGKLARYESAIERSIDRSLRQLKALQQARQANQPPANTTTCETKPNPETKPPATSHQQPATAAKAAPPLKSASQGDQDQLSG